MKATRYFTEQVQRKRPYIQEEWIQAVLAGPEATEVEESGRIRHWGFIVEIGKYLRVVTLEDGETVHNAFPDRSYKGQHS